MGERSKKFFSDKPRLRKIVGVILVAVGVLAFLTPLTPGSWLALIGLELLGVDLIFWDKIKGWFWKLRGKIASTEMSDEKTKSDIAIFGGVPRSKAEDGLLRGRAFSKNSPDTFNPIDMVNEK